MVRNTIANETKSLKTDLFDKIKIKFEHLKEIMQAIYKEKFPLKIHLLKDLHKSQKASSLLNIIIVDWLVNNNRADFRQKKKLVNSKSVPKLANTVQMDGQTSNHLKENKGPDRQKIFAVFNKTDQIKGQSNIKETLDQLNQEKLYLLRAQDQTNIKITKFKMANTDLVKEYNQLYEKGRKLYESFFELFYAIKLNSKSKYSKLGFTEDDLNFVKEFKKFQKLSVIDHSNSEDNPMINIIRSKSSKMIINSTIAQTNSKIAKSNMNI